ncbi:hypothetical protein CYLTODRAFT_445427 [Cylindrobasidium torrendii FP15055 ss-10]|uniref:C2H2-type domain-containing protein n=1 Tax=Cylindrobasidium torrendii FP15055 ss-10 TaxID=1314674 RepID=A0A0D7B433_9AGAR|nr:hypothetical protein CYLTODRAFT_445427 [Cylindrobasidium torrendii FP15055 ss-10]
MAGKDKIWKCAKCDYSAARSSDVMRHYKATHCQSQEEQEKLKWKCLHDGCSHSSLQKSNLDNHIMMKHINTKPYKCTCGEGFGYERALTDHVKLEGTTDHVAIKLDKAEFKKKYPEAYAKVCPPAQETDQDDKESWVVLVGAGSAKSRSASAKSSKSPNSANSKREDGSAATTSPATAAQEGNETSTIISSSAEMSASRIGEASSSKTSVPSSSRETLSDIVKALKLTRPLGAQYETGFPPPPSPPKRLAVLEPSASVNSAVTDTTARPKKRKDREDTENDTPSGSEPRKVARRAEDSSEVQKSDVSLPKVTIPAPRLIRRGPPPPPVETTALQATPSLNVPSTYDSDALGKTASSSDYHYNASFPTHCDSCKKLAGDVKVVMAVVEKVYGKIAVAA